MLNRIFNKTKRSFIHAQYSIGFTQKRINPGKIGNHIIMYHGVALVENKKFNQRFIGVHNLKKQLIYLKKNANLISMTDFFEEKFDATKNNVAITFDDGFLNNYTYAVPLLEELKNRSSTFEFCDETTKEYLGKIDYSMMIDGDQLVQKFTKDFYQAKKTAEKAGDVSWFDANVDYNEAKCASSPSAGAPVAAAPSSAVTMQFLTHCKALATSAFVSEAEGIARRLDGTPNGCGSQGAKNSTGSQTARDCAVLLSVACSSSVGLALAGEMPWTSAFAQSICDKK
jgi:hypothetical protein